MNYCTTPPDILAVVYSVPQYK